jgi:hypothetical protein
MKRSRTYFLTRRRLSSTISDRILAALQGLPRAEKAARTALEAGCCADLEQVERFIEPPLGRARLELAAYLTSLGALDPILSASLKRRHAEDVSSHCACDAFANASVRFRARFRTYAEALVAAQKNLVETAALSMECSPPRAPRRIALPRIELDNERSVTPEYQPSLSQIDEWTAELNRRLQAALQSVVLAARAKTLDRGAAAVARTSVAVRLAALAQPRSRRGAVAPKMRSYRSLP